MLSHPLLSLLLSSFSPPLLSCRFAAQTISSGALVLVSLELRESTATLTINTEKSVMASVLLRDLKQALSQA